jgi:ATP-dependent protease ClpP protease subunit
MPLLKRFPILNGPAGTAGKYGYTISAAAGGIGEIFIYDVIGDPWDGTTGKQFAKDLKALGKVSELHIFINSPGGSVFDGFAIFNQLQRHKARKLVSIDGMALSIASVIAMVGDEISIAANAMMMIHDPWSIGFGNAAEFRKLADLLDKIGANIVGAYATRTGLPDEQLAAMMAEETWLDAAEAVELGFADAVGAEIQIAAKAHGADFSKFKHTPPHLVKAAALAPVDYAVRVRNLRQRLETEAA